MPVLFSVTVCEPLLPTVTLPKLMLVGLAVSADCRPVPVIAMLVGEVGALLVIEMFPAGLPALAGVKVAVIGELAPAAIETGSVNPLTE